MESETRKPKPGTEPLNLAEIRARLAGVNGREYWRSLEELAETEEFREFLHREFPRQMSAWADGFSRREFLRLMGASLALAGLNACAPSRTDEKIVPYVRQPEEIVPGKPLFFATAFTLAGIATGLLVESHEGRPTKVEGNPLHPASLGATDAFAQASVLALYDPDRSQVVANRGRISTWSAFYEALTAELGAQRIRQGAGLRVLTETITSPTLAHQMLALLAKFPRAKWHAYEPAGRDNARRGALLAFGKQVDAYYRLEKADVILSLDSDFLFYGPGSARYVRDFTARRRVSGSQPAMNRFYVIESSPSVTGSAADHSLSLPPGEIEPVALAIAGKLGLRPRPPGRDGFPWAREKWIAAVARDLEKSRGRSVVITGESQPSLVHALAHAMNHALGNAGQTVLYIDPVETGPADQAASLKELIEDMDAGKVEMLVILGGNPVFTAPVDLGLEKRMSRVKFRVRLGLYEDETSSLCHWHIPETHYLEAWSDACAYDGTVSLLQPLIAPLYDGRSAHEFLSALAGEPARSGYDIVRDYWKERHRGNDFELFWRTGLHDGVVADTAYPPRRVTLLPIERWETKREDGGAPPADSFNIVFRPDPTIFDGRFANNGWLQELPKPLTKLTWDNAAIVGPASAERLGVQNEELVELRFRGRAVRAPIWIVPGQPENTVTVHLGYGRTRAGKVGNGAGFNAYQLRTTDALWHGGGL